jgi:ABC-type bacteriocin/lantibiotic exporter with double-glycine peptidase domain
MMMGYATRLGTGGAGLSGGQRQRIALARAVACRPRILLLDEATSALDTATEQVVERNLGALTCTRIVIAHRLSTVRDADQIVVLDGGVIVERGTHAELLRLRGRYHALVQAQLTEEPQVPALAAGGER